MIDYLNQANSVMDATTKKHLQKAHKLAEEGNNDEALYYCDKTMLQYGKQSVPFDVLNLRAAVFIKLHRFSEAGVDGGKMVKHFPSDPRGYLRLAQVYRYKARQTDFIDNIRKAIRVLGSGLSRADKSNRDFLPQIKSMKRLFDELQTSLEPAILPDLALKLPLELFQQVLSYCPSRDVLRWRKVSKLWNNAIRNAPLWKSLHINQDFMPRTTQQANFLIGLAKSNTDRRGLLHFQIDLTASRRKGTGNDLRCEDLSSIVVLKCDSLRTLSMDFEPSRSWQHVLENVRHQHMTKIEILPRLSKLWNHQTPTFTSLHEMRTASVESRVALYDETDICKVLSNLPSLEEAVFCGFTFKNSEEWHWNWPTTNFLVRSLVISPRSAGHAGHDAICIKALDLGQLSCFAPNLELLELGSCVFLSAEPSEPSDFTVFSQMKCLRLDWHPSCRELLCLVFPKIPSTLQELMLECPDNVPVFETETDPSEIVHLRHIRRLRLSGQFAYDIDRLVRISGPHLQELTLIDRGIPLGETMSVNGSSQASENWMVQTFKTLSESSQIQNLRHATLLSPFIFRTPDALAALIAISCPNLEKISVFGDCGFTGIGFAKLCNKTGTKLRTIEVGRCPKAKADTVQYVRSHGIAFSGRVGPM